MADTGAATELIVVTTSTADFRAVVARLADQLPGRNVTPCAGYYAAMSAIGSADRVVVVHVSADAGRDGWRLAELRHRGAAATIVIVADAVDLPGLKGALQGDLAVTSPAGLPPLRELLLSASGTPDAQTMLRRSTR